MWLLDLNLPNGLVSVLNGFGIQCDTTIAGGWRELANGTLAAAAFKAGFRLETLRQIALAMEQLKLDQRGSVGAHVKRVDGFHPWARDSQMVRETMEAFAAFGGELQSFERTHSHFVVENGKP